MLRRGTIPLGRLFGIPIGLDYSWFLIFGLLTWSLASNYYPARYADWPAVQYWGLGALTAVLLFASVLLHELGHALVARGFKIPVRRIRLMIFGGVAEMGDESPDARAEFTVAVAGPLVSVLVGLAAGAGWLVLRAAGLFEPLVALLGYLALINVLLAGFNMIPGFPLDGGRVLRAIVWGATRSMRRATLIAGNIGRVIGFGFIGLGLLQMFTGGLVNGIWMAFIGMFLQGAASAEMRGQAVRESLSGRTVAQVMSRGLAALPSTLTLQQLIDAHILGGGQRAFAVVDGGRVLGLLTINEVRQVPAAERLYTTLAEAMVPVDDLKTVQPDTALWTALKRMEIEELGHLPVVEDGRLQGVLRREDVFSFLRTLDMLGPGLARP